MQTSAKMVNKGIQYDLEDCSCANVEIQCTLMDSSPCVANIGTETIDFTHQNETRQCCGSDMARLGDHEDTSGDSNIHSACSDLTSTPVSISKSYDERWSTRLNKQAIGTNSDIVTRNRYTPISEDSGTYSLQEMSNIQCSSDQENEARLHLQDVSSVQCASDQENEDISNVQHASEQENEARLRLQDVSNVQYASDQENEDIPNVQHASEQENEGSYMSTVCDFGMHSLQDIPKVQCASDQENEAGSMSTVYDYVSHGRLPLGYKELEHNMDDIYRNTSVNTTMPIKKFVVLEEN